MNAVIEIPGEETRLELLVPLIDIQSIVDEHKHVPFVVTISTDTFDHAKCCTKLDPKSLRPQNYLALAMEHQDLLDLSLGLPVQD